MALMASVLVAEQIDLVILELVQAMPLERGL